MNTHISLLSNSDIAGCYVLREFLININNSIQHRWGEVHTQNKMYNKNCTINIDVLQYSSNYCITEIMCSGCYLHFIYFYLNYLAPISSAI